MQNKKNATEKKQAYEKPKLRTIELLAEEVMGVGCKIAPGAPGQAVSTCTTGVCLLTPGS
jgi:hypothetical protein